MNRPCSLSLAITLACMCGSARAVDPSKHKPGLWEMTRQTGDVELVSQMCFDSASEAKGNATECRLHRFHSLKAMY